MLTCLGEHDKIDWNRASIDGYGTKPPGSQETGPNPTDGGKLRSKLHMVVDARGIPLLKLAAALRGSMVLASLNIEEKFHENTESPNCIEYYSRASCLLVNNLVDSNDT